MSQVHVSAERVLDAPANVVYQCIAGYERHHRPGGFLPPAFSDQRVDRGGIGAGTVITFKMHVAGRTQTATSEITEPQPGRVLVESSQGVDTVFTVEPEGDRSRVRFDTTLDAPGVSGLFMRLLAPRLLRPIYEDELGRLERYAQSQAAVRS